MKEKRRISEYVIFWLKRGVSSRVLYVSLIKNEIINNNHSMFEQKYNFVFFIFLSWLFALKLKCFIVLKLKCFMHENVHFNSSFFFLFCIHQNIFYLDVNYQKQVFTCFFTFFYYSVFFKIYIYMTQFYNEKLEETKFNA